MSSETDHQTQFALEEFTSSYENQLLYYHILRMSGCVYVWVGTDAGEQGCLVAAMSSRPGVEGPSPVTTIIGGVNQDAATGCAARLQAKLLFPVWMSVNTPQDLTVLEHIERTLLQKLSS